MKIYADTSVFGGVFDQEFSGASKQFFDEVDAGRFVLVTSAVVEAEIEPAPKKIQTFFAKYAEFVNIADTSKEALSQVWLLRNQWMMRSMLQSQQYLAAI